MSTRAVTRLHCVLAALACMLAVVVAPPARAADNHAPRPSAHAASNHLVVSANHHEAPNYDQDTPTVQRYVPPSSTPLDEPPTTHPSSTRPTHRHERAPPGATTQPV